MLALGDGEHSWRSKVGCLHAKTGAVALVTNGDADVGLLLERTLRRAPSIVTS